MAVLRELQNEFLGYLLDNSSASIVERIESSPKRSAKERMDLYGVSYKLRLKEAISTDYDRLYSYLGDELFEQLMLNYIKRYPSHHPSLRYFSQHMVELVEQLKPFDQLPEVAEIAHIEKAFCDSFDAANCHSIDITELAQLDADVWATLKLDFHASVQQLPQQYNSFQIWKALSNDEIPPEKVTDEATWLIWRQALVSRYRALSAAEAMALNIAMTGGTFGELCEALLDFFSEEEIPKQAVGFLQRWINDQMVCELTWFAAPTK